MKKSSKNSAKTIKVAKKLVKAIAKSTAKDAAKKTRVAGKKLNPKSGMLVTKAKHLSVKDAIALVKKGERLLNSNFKPLPFYYLTKYFNPSSMIDVNVIQITK